MAASLNKSAIPDSPHSQRAGVILGAILATVLPITFNTAKYLFVDWQSSSKQTLKQLEDENLKGTRFIDRWKDLESIDSQEAATFKHRLDFVVVTIEDIAKQKTLSAGTRRQLDGELDAVDEESAKLQAFLDFVEAPLSFEATSRKGYVDEYRSYLIFCRDSEPSPKLLNRLRDKSRELSRAATRWSAETRTFQYMIKVQQEDASSRRELANRNLNRGDLKALISTLWLVGSLILCGRLLNSTRSDDVAAISSPVAGRRQLTNKYPFHRRKASRR